MIIKEHQLQKIFTEDAKFLGILIYGPNDGLVKEQIEKITDTYLIKDEYEKISFNGKDLDHDPQMLNDITSTVSMFFKKKIVIGDTIKDKHLNIIGDIVLNAPQDTVLIIRDGNLNKSSKIRNFFEKENNSLSLACYEDDGRSIIKNIDEFSKKNNLELNQDIKNYLLQTLSNDRLVSKRELEKIEIFYRGSKEKTNLDVIKKLLNDSSSQNLNKMNENVMFGNTTKSSKIINKLLSEGTSPVSLIRSLSNYLTRMQQTKIEMKKGNNFETSIRILKPPVFWKDKDNFQTHCLKWPLRTIEKNLVNLLETEIACKINSRLANINCEKSILIIANNGRQYFKN